MCPTRGVLGELYRESRTNRRQKTRCRYHLLARCRLLRQRLGPRLGMQRLTAGKTKSPAELRRRRASCACLTKQLCTLFLSERQRRWPGRYQKPEERTHEDSRQVDRRQRSTTPLMGLEVRVIHGLVPSAACTWTDRRSRGWRSWLKSDVSRWQSTQKTGKISENGSI